jgi:hypothetical protein
MLIHLDWPFAQFPLLDIEGYHVMDRIPQRNSMSCR